MLKKILIDTDILIDLFRGSTYAIKFMENVMTHSECYISPLTISELYTGVREGNERLVLDRFVEDFNKATFNETIAKKGGLFRRDYLLSHKVGLADALIAATAENYGLTLATLNRKNYPMLENVHVPYVKDSVKTFR